VALLPRSTEIQPFVAKYCNTSAGTGIFPEGTGNFCSHLPDWQERTGKWSAN